MNIVALTGRFTSDPELKTTQSGVSVISFCLAVDRKYQQSGEEKKVDFIDCVAWRNTAEFVSKYFRKGSMIAVEGEIQTRTYTDKNDNKRKAVEILVNHVSFCGSKSDGSNSNQNQAVDDEDDPLQQFSDNISGFALDGNDDDLPF